MPNTYYVFRQPESVDELKVLLVLRYHAYMASRLSKFIAENEEGLDLDCYDLYFHHFGLYEHDGDDSRPIGYVRMVTDEAGTFHDELLTLANSEPTLCEMVSRSPEVPFPLMKYCPCSDRVREVYDAMKLKGERLMQSGRLSLHPSVRRLQLAAHFIAALSACFIAHGAAKAILSCAQSHEAIYRRFGATQFDDATLFHVDGAGVSLLLLAPKQLPKSMQERVLSMCGAYEATGRICYDPENPGVYFPPSENLPVMSAVAA